MKLKTKRRTSKASIIVNPISGKGDAQSRRKLLKSLARDLGWVGNYIETTSEKTATNIASKEIAKGIKHIVVCGGDGTIMEALDAVSGKKVAMGIVPLGTGNLFARNLSIPLETKEAMGIALWGNQQTIDVGRANGTLFSVIAGIGLDAQVMQETNREMKNKFGLAAYAITILKGLRDRPSSYKITLDNKKPFIVRAKTVMAANMGKLMGGMEIVPSTHPQSGSFQLGILNARSLTSWLNLLLHSLRGSIDNSSHYEIYNARHIVIESLSGKKFYECDGNHFPLTQKLTIDILPKNVTVMVSLADSNLQNSDSKKILLFDFDGTLADSFDMVMRIANGLAKKYNFSPILPDQIEGLRGMNASDIVTHLSIPKIKLPFLLMEGRKEFKENLELIKPFPQLSHVLSLLSKKYRMGIVTSNDSVSVKKFLLKNQMDYFDFIYSDSSLFGKGKILRDVIKEYGLNKDNVSYIGDEVRDIEAAREAEIKIISVTWGFNTKEVLRKNKPDKIVDTIKEFGKLFI